MRSQLSFDSWDRMSWKGACLLVTSTTILYRVSQIKSIVPDVEAYSAAAVNGGDSEFRKFLFFKALRGSF